MKNLFSLILDFITRNPLTTLIFVLLCVAAPQVLGIFALILLVPLVLAIAGGAFFLWKVRKAQRNVEQKMREAQGRASYSERKYSGAGSTREGNVTVTATEPQQKRVSDDVGEYVDFKEVKE